MPNLFHLFLLALLGSIIALAGGIVFLLSKNLSGFLEKHSVPFAAGVLITVSLIALLPESYHQIQERAFFVALASFFAAYLFEHFLFDIHHHEHKHHKDRGISRVRSSVALVVVGDTIHNFIDGIAIAAAFFVNPGLGLVTSISTFLHEVPHEIGDFGILLRAGYSRMKVLLINAVSATATIVGAFAFLLVSHNNDLIGIMLGVSAGIFLYLGAIDFLPHAHDEYNNKFTSIIPLALGVVVMIVALLAIPHSHDHEEDHDHEEPHYELTLKASSLHS